MCSLLSVFPVLPVAEFGAFGLIVFLWYTSLTSLLFGGDILSGLVLLSSSLLSLSKLAALGDGSHFIGISSFGFYLFSPLLTCFKFNLSGYFYF